MITLYQHPVSPFCITTEAILKFAKADHRVVNLPYSDRRIIVEKSQGRSYKIPLFEDGKTIVWDKTDFGQEVARYLDEKFKLGLFPSELEGIQEILARYIEAEVEMTSFKLNDIYCESWLSDLYDRTMFLRHKERKFGAGCIASWRDKKDDLQRQLDALLTPLNQMLSRRPYLIDARPRFVDFDLFGIIGNYLFSGHNKLPKQFGHLKRWYEGMLKLG
ncbi:MAG: glutathione S-transferase family protein [Nitrospirae bacterium]|nr:glutathione S-transferase family protein [Nitrospirota bacterium]